MVYQRGHTKYRGYSWKRCPYSQWYWDNYLSQGYTGNSNNPNLSSINISKITTHSDTEGTMNYHNKGGVPGWICNDPDCWYLSEYGRKYFEP